LSRGATWLDEPDEEEDEEEADTRIPSIPSIRLVNALKRGETGVPMVPPGSGDEIQSGGRLWSLVRGATRRVTTAIGLSQPVEDEDEDSEDDSADDYDHYVFCNIVRCPDGHVMNAKIIREVVGRTPFRMHCCSKRRNQCSSCSTLISDDDSKYTCKSCNVTYCKDCSRAQLGLPTTRDSDGDEGPCVQILAGDILLCGPDALGIHHVVLVTSELVKEPGLGAYLDLEPGVEVWSCNTIESVQNSKGDNWWWYPARSFFGRDPYKRAAYLVADQPNLRGDIEAIVPVPMKIIISPLRTEFGGPGIDEEVYSQAVRAGAEASKQYSHVTRFTMAVSYVMQQLNLQDGHIVAARYPTPDSRTTLLQAIKATWDRPPICSTVPIQCWQRYFVMMAGNDSEVAIDLILRYMPILCHTALPATLTKELTKFGWVLRDHLEP
jgi:hypothetical protein